MDAQTYGIESLASDIVKDEPGLSDRVHYILGEFRDERLSPDEAWEALKSVAPEWAPGNERKTTMDQKHWSHLLPTGHPQVNLLTSPDPDNDSAVIGGIVCESAPESSDATADYAEQLAGFLGLDSDSIIHSHEEDTPFYDGLQRFTPQPVPQPFAG
jgi:hypothetical protein